jgi:hypothetical protein
MQQTERSVIYQEDDISFHTGLTFMIRIIILRNFHHQFLSAVLEYKYLVSQNNWLLANYCETPSIFVQNSSPEISPVAAKSNQAHLY